MSGWRRVAGLLWLLLLPHWLAAQEPAPAPIVREVEVKFDGPVTVNKAIVLANIQTAVGQPLSESLIQQDVRDLINTGYFFDVRVAREPVADGVKVIYQVRGKATIKEVLFEGYKHFKLARLQRDVTLKAGDTYDERKAHDDARKLVESYQKAAYPDAKVEPEASIDKDTGKAIVRFKVTEGPRVFLKRVQFDGVQAVPVKKLRKLMKTRHRWWGSWMGGTGVIKDEQLQEDLEAVREFYRSQGYLDMTIKGSRVERTAEKWMVLHVEIFEGVQYKVGATRIEGHKLFPAADLEAKLKMTKGKTFTPAGLEADTKAVEDYYGARGYIDTSVRTVRTPSAELEHIDLTYLIREGDLTYIEKIQIRGNTKTKDKVIRRELAVAPGQVFDMVRVDRSADRLRNLNYFSKVETSPYPTDVPNRKDLVVTVEEQRTGTVTFGAGFSSVDNLVGFVEVTQGNFDLFNWPTFTGGGQKLRLRMQVGFERQDYILSFTEPWFLDRKLALGVDLFHRSSSFLSDEFDETRTGGALRLEKALAEFVRGQIEYSLQNIDLDVDSTASMELQAEQGADLRSAVEFSLIYDTRDNVFLTSRGNRTELSAEVVGGAVGGDVSLYKLNLKSSQYFPLFQGHVLQFVGAAGVVDVYGASRGDGTVVTEINGSVTNTVKVNDVPIYDRHFLGGPYNLRGFDYRDVSPRDVNGEPVGGNTYAHATAEYSFPIVERVRGAFFFDIGNVWRDAYELGTGDLKSDVGVGVRLNLPIGPLRLDYGYPVMTDNQTGRGGKIQFSVGYQF